MSTMLKTMLFMFANLFLLNLGGSPDLAYGNGAFASGERTVELAAASVNDANKHNQMAKQVGNNTNVTRRSFVGNARVYTKGENTYIALLDKNGKPFFTPFDASLSKNGAFYDCMVEGDYGNGDPVTVSGEFKTNSDGTFSVANYASLQCSQKGASAPKTINLEFGRYEFVANGMKTKFVIFGQKVEGKDMIFMMFSSDANDDSNIFYAEGECKKGNGTLTCKVDADNEMVKKNNNTFEFAVADNSLQLTKQIPGMFGKATINQPVFQLKESKKDCPDKTFLTKSATGIYKGVDMLELEGGGEVQIMMLNVDGKEMFINTGDVDVFPVLEDKMDKKIAVTYDMVQEWHAMAGACMKFEKLKSLKPLQ